MFFYIQLIILIWKISHFLSKENYFKLENNKQVWAINSIKTIKTNSKQNINCLQECLNLDQCQLVSIDNQSCSFYDKCFLKNKLNNNYQTRAFLKHGICTRDYSLLKSI